MKNCSLNRRGGKYLSPLCRYSEELLDEASELELSADKLEEETASDSEDGELKLSDDSPDDKFSELEEFSDELELSELDDSVELDDDSATDEDNDDDSAAADALDSEDELLLVIMSGTATELSDDELGVEFAIGATCTGSTFSSFFTTGS